MSAANGELLTGWPEVTLGDIGEVIRGVSYKKEQARAEPAAGYLPLLRATNIGAELTFDGLVYVPDSLVGPSQRLRRNDIVIAASSGSIKVVGKAAQLRSEWDGAFGAFCAVFRPSATVDPEYVAQFMASPAYRARISNLAAGVNINNLKREHILSTPIPLPPYEEQARLVETVGGLLASCRAGVAGFERALDGAQQLRAVCLAEAFGGETRPLEDLAHIQSGIAKGRPASAELFEVPYIRTANVQALRLDLEEMKTLSVSAEQRQKHRLEPDDVLVLEGGDADKVGRGWIWSGEVPGCLHQNHVFAVRADAEQLVPRYLAYYINAPQARRYFLAVAKQTVNLASINKTNLRELPVPAPPVEEQRKTVEVLDRRLTAITAMAAGLRERLVDAELMRLSTLHAAYSGQLTRSRTGPERETSAMRP